MSIAIGSDHAGFPLKAKLVEFLQQKNIDFKDMGTFNEDQVDYPDFAFKVAKSVSSGESQLGVVVCGTGLGVSMMANKVRGIRAALCCSEYMAELAKEHNNANILAMGSRTTTPDIGIRILNTFLTSEFEGGRHSNRVEKIHDLSGR
jgi:ribose 5-phosphate isomerase B